MNGAKDRKVSRLRGDAWEQFGEGDAGHRRGGGSRFRLRDAWLAVQLFRHLGLAARFVSGYLIQLTPDVKSLDGPSGTAVDFTGWVDAVLGNLFLLFPATLGATVRYWTSSRLRARSRERK